MSANDAALLASHDAEIISITVDHENSICRIGFSHEGNKRSSIELLGAVAFRAEDFGLQNVVSRMLRSTRKDFSEGDLAYWLEWATSLSDSPSWLRPEKKHEWIEALNDGELELVVLEPSAGAQIAVVCARMRQVR